MQSHNKANTPYIRDTIMRRQHTQNTQQNINNKPRATTRQSKYVSNTRYTKKKYNNNTKSNANNQDTNNNTIAINQTTQTRLKHIIQTHKKYKHNTEPTTHNKTSTIKQEQ